MQSPRQHRHWHTIGSAVSSAVGSAVGSTVGHADAATIFNAAAVLGAHHRPRSNPGTYNSNNHGIAHGPKLCQWGHPSLL